MNYFKDLKVRTQLLLVFIAVILLFALANIYTIYRIAHLSSTSNYIDDNYTSSYSELNDIDVKFSYFQRTLISLALSFSSTELDFDEVLNKADMEYEEVKKSIEIYRQKLQAIDSPNRSVMFEQFIDVFNNEFVPEVEKFRSSAVAGNLNQVYVTINNIIYDGESLSGIIQSILDFNIDTMSTLSSSISDNANTTVVVAIVIITCATVLALILCLYFGNSFSKRLSLLSTVAREVASGQLNVNVADNSQDEIGILSKDISQITDILTKITYEIKTLGNEHLEGKISKVLDTSKFQGGFAEIVTSINNTIEGLTGDIKVFLDVVEEFSNGNFSAELPPLPGEKVIFNQVSDTMRNNLLSINKEITDLINSANNGELSHRSNADLFNGDWKKILLALNSLMTAIEDPIHEVTSVLIQISKGNIENQITANYKGDFGVIKDALNSTSAILKSYISDISDVLNKMAHNNLNVSISNEYVGEFVEIKDAINTIIEQFNTVFREFYSSSEQVLSGARQLSESSLTLAEGATEQSSSVKLLNDTIDTINEQIQDSAEKARKVNELSELAKVNAKNGDNAMSNMLRSMDKISDSSKDIERIIKVIDDIAFQTNLLALNAAVEAARAGVHGRGFAVVAEEVRSLAARSQEAAKETNELIANSLSSVSEGTKLAHSTDKALSEILNSINKMSEIITEISQLSTQQASGMSTITTSIGEVSTVVHSNSASAQQGAASSEELSGQSEMLKNMIAVFELKS